MHGVRKYSKRDGMDDGLMTCDFMSFLTVFQSYQVDVWMIVKGFVELLKRTYLTTSFQFSVPNQ